MVNGCITMKVKECLGAIETFDVENVQSINKNEISIFIKIKFRYFYLIIFMILLNDKRVKRFLYQI
jgi:hypothetical protein